MGYDTILRNSIQRCRIGIRIGDDRAFLAKAIGPKKLCIRGEVSTKDGNDGDSTAVEIDAKRVGSKVE